VECVLFRGRIIPPNWKQGPDERRYRRASSSAPSVAAAFQGAGTGTLLSSIHETQAHQGNRFKEPYRNSARDAFRCASSAATVPSTITTVSCYKFEMPKPVVQWLLFKYIDGEITFLSKPFKTKQLAEKARSKYSERERKGIGVGVVRIES
jgi:hypothetical protein